MDKDAAGFSELTSYPATLLKSKSLFWAPSLCTGKRSCDLQTGSLTFSFSVYIRFTSFSCLVSLAKMSRMILIVILIILVRTGILFWFQDLEARLSACPHSL